MVVRFIEARTHTKDCPGFSSVPLWKNFSFVFIKPRSRSNWSIYHDPEMCYWFSPRQCLVQFSLCRHQLASLVPVPGCTPASAALLYPGSRMEPTLGVLEAARPAWWLQRVTLKPTELREKNFKGRCIRDCEVAGWFTCDVESKEFPSWFPSVLTPTTWFNQESRALKPHPHSFLWLAIWMEGFSNLSRQEPKIQSGSACSGTWLHSHLDVIDWIIMGFKRSKIFWSSLI